MAKICDALKCEITNDSGSVIFSCPNCGKADVIRSSHARSIAAKYKCHECGFEGPN